MRCDEHLEDDVKSLCDTHRALKPRGEALLGVPQHRWLWSELAAKCRSVGFGAVVDTSFVFGLVPLMAAQT